MTLDELLHSPQFKQALFDVQAEECERCLNKTNHTHLTQEDVILIEKNSVPTPYPSSSPALQTEPKSPRPPRA